MASTGRKNLVIKRPSNALLPARYSFLRSRTSPVGAPDVDGSAESKEIQNPRSVIKTLSSGGDESHSSTCCMTNKLNESCAPKHSTSPEMSSNFLGEKKSSDVPAKTFCVSGKRENKNEKNSCSPAATKNYEKLKVCHSNANRNFIRNKYIVTVVSEDSGRNKVAHPSLEMQNHRKLLRKSCKSTVLNKLKDEHCTLSADSEKLEANIEKKRDKSPIGCNETPAKIHKDQVKKECRESSTNSDKSFASDEIQKKYCKSSIAPIRPNDELRKKSPTKINKMPAAANGCKDEVRKELCELPTHSDITFTADKLIQINHDTSPTESDKSPTAKRLIDEVQKYHCKLPTENKPSVSDKLEEKVQKKRKSPTDSDESSSAKCLKHEVRVDHCKLPTDNKGSAAKRFKDEVQKEQFKPSTDGGKLFATDKVQKNDFNWSVESPVGNGFNEGREKSATENNKSSTLSDKSSAIDRQNEVQKEHRNPPGENEPPVTNGKYDDCDKHNPNAESCETDLKKIKLSEEFIDESKNTKSPKRFKFSEIFHTNTELNKLELLACAKHLLDKCVQDTRFDVFYRGGDSDKQGEEGPGKLDVEGGDESKHVEAESSVQSSNSNARASDKVCSTNQNVLDHVFISSGIEELKKIIKETVAASILNQLRVGNVISERLENISNWPSKESQNAIVASVLESVQRNCTDPNVNISVDAMVTGSLLAKEETVKPKVTSEESLKRFSPSESVCRPTHISTSIPSEEIQVIDIKPASFLAPLQKSEKRQIREKSINGLKKSLPLQRIVPLICEDVISNASNRSDNVMSSGKTPTEENKSRNIYSSQNSVNVLKVEDVRAETDVEIIQDVPLNLAGKKCYETTSLGRIASVINEGNKNGCELPSKSVNAIKRNEFVKKVKKMKLETEEYLPKKSSIEPAEDFGEPAGNSSRGHDCDERIFDASTSSYGSKRVKLSKCDERRSPHQMRIGHSTSSLQKSVPCAFLGRKGNQSSLSKSLHKNVGKRFVGINDLPCLILEWNPNWLLTQKETKKCPPICDALTAVKDAYEDDLDYYNTYFPLHLLSIWLKISNAWKKAPMAFDSVYECQMEKPHSVKITCSTVLSYALFASWPRREDIILCRARKFDGSVKELFGRVCNVMAKDYIPPANCKTGGGTLLKMVRFDFYCIEGLEVSLHATVRVQILCNIRMALLQNEALQHLNQSLKEMILNPAKHASGGNFVPLPHRSTCGPSYNKAVENIIRSSLSVRVTLVDTTGTPSASDVLRAIASITFGLTKASTFVLIGLRSVDSLPELMSHLKSWPNVVLAVKKKEVKLPEELKKLTLEHRCEVMSVREIFSECHVTVTLLSSVFMGNFTDVLPEQRLTCILHEADLWTETESALLLCYGVERLVLVGKRGRDADIHPLLRRFRYDRSLFGRFCTAKRRVLVS